jgi:acetyl esterase/lipase
VSALVLAVVAACGGPVPSSPGSASGAGDSTTVAAGDSGDGAGPGSTSGAGSTDRAAAPAGAPSPSTGGCADPSAPATVAYASFPAVDPDLTSLDVHTRPEACGWPVAVWVHGGGYRTGDKANQMADKVRLAGEQGWVLVSVNYRLTDPGSPTAAVYPDHFTDVAAALGWVHESIGRYGGDPSRIAVLGHSAGADIVANVVTDPRYLAAEGLELADVVCAGPLDTEGFDKVAAGAGDPDGEQLQWKTALGNQPDYLTSTSATRLIRPDIGIPPMIGVVRGTERRQEIERAFLETLEANGIEATEIDARSLTHNEVNSRIGEPGDTVMTAPLVAFLTDCFAR